MKPLPLRRHSLLVAHAFWLFAAAAAAPALLGRARLGTVRHPRSGPHYRNPGTER